MSSKKKQGWIRSIADEIESLVERRTFNVVPKPGDRKLIKCRWVFDVKRDENDNFARFLQKDILKYTVLTMVKYMHQLFAWTTFDSC